MRVADLTELKTYPEPTILAQPTNSTLNTHTCSTRTHRDIHVVMVTCKVCQIQNVGSTKGKYGGYFNNYKSVQHKVREKVVGKIPLKPKRGRSTKQRREIKTRMAEK